MMSKTVSILVPDISSNILWAATAIGQALQPDWAVQIVGPDFGRGVFGPCRGLFPYTAVPVNRLYRWPDYGWESRRIERAVTGEVVIAMKAFMNTLGLALGLKRSRGVKVVAYLDEWDGAVMRQQPFGARVRRWIKHAHHPLDECYAPWVERGMARADAVVSTTSFLRKRFGGVTIPLGVDMEAFAPQPSVQIARLRQELGLVGRKVVVFGGVAHRHKGLETLLEAMASLPERVNHGLDGLHGWERSFDHGGHGGTEKAVLGSLFLVPGSEMESMCAPFVSSNRPDNTTNRLSPTAYQEPGTKNEERRTSNQQPTTKNEERRTKNQEPSATLLVVGPETAYLRELAGQPQWGNLLVCAGPQPRDRMPLYLSLADAVVLPQNDTLLGRSQMPCKVFEAMAMGLPVIASAVSDLPEVLDGCGWTVPPGDPGALAERLAWVLDHEEEARRMGAAARAKCGRLYSREVAQRAWLDLLGRVA